MRSTALLALCWLLGCAHAPSAVGPGPLRYEIEYAPGALTVTVEGASAVRDFLFSQPGAVEAVVLPGGAELHVGPDGGVFLPPGVDRFSYRFVPAGDDLFRGVEANGELLVAGRAYLIRPRAAARTGDVELRAPPDAHLPWAPDAHGLFHLRGVDLVDSGFHAFGGRGCPAPLGAIDVRLVGPPTAAGDARLCEWIAQAAREVATVRAKLPYARVAVNLVPVPGEAASPFGMVLWSNPPSVAILVGEQATDAEFDRDWVATHELLHLSHPAVFPKQAWLTEGLATYFTELARWRSGRFTEAQAFTELAAGFARGEDEAGPRAFAEFAGSEGKGSYLALYWKGALLRARARPRAAPPHRRSPFTRRRARLAGDDHRSRPLWRRGRRDRRRAAVRRAPRTSSHRRGLRSAPRGAGVARSVSRGRRGEARAGQPAPRSTRRAPREEH